MKTLLTLIALTIAHSAFAQQGGGKAYPLCDERDSNPPCVYPKDEADGEVADMMIDNIKGMTKIMKQAPGIKSGHSGGFMLENTRVIMLKQVRAPGGGPGRLTTTTGQYEIILNDCRGTDACGGYYLWTVTAVTESDGYCYETKYENKLEKINYSSFVEPLGETK